MTHSEKSLADQLFDHNLYNMQRLNDNLPDFPGLGLVNHFQFNFRRVVLRHSVVDVIIVNLNYTVQPDYDVIVNRCGDRMNIIFII